MDAAPVLELRGITKRFPGVLANDHVDFDLRDGRGARPARRERRRQVDADEHPVRPVPADEGEILIKGKPVAFAVAAATPSPRHRHGAPALHADPGDDGHREHRARERADERRCVPRLCGRRSVWRRSRSGSASRSTPTHGSRTSPWASSSASRSSRRSTATPTSSSSTSRRPCSRRRRRSSCSRFCEGLVGEGMSIIFISHKLNEVLDDRRSHHGAAPGQEDRDDRRARARQRRAGPHDGRPRGPPLGRQAGCVSRRAR